LVVEILSPSTTRIDRVRKRELYAQYGIPYHWIVDPVAGTLEAYGLSDGHYALLARASGAGPRGAAAVPRPLLRARLALALTGRSAGRSRDSARRVRH
jgi:hypothetical protein